MVAMAAGTVAMGADTALAGRISAAADIMLAAGITSADIAAASRAIRSDGHTLDAPILAGAVLRRGTKTSAPCAMPPSRLAMPVTP